MKEVIIEVLNKAIKEDDNQTMCQVLSVLGNNNYVVFYDLKGFIVNIKKSKLAI